MHVHIEFSIDNAAFRDDDDEVIWEAVENIIHDTAKEIEHWGPDDTRGKIHDRNGNLVGHWEVKE